MQGEAQPSGKIGSKIKEVNLFSLIHLFFPQLGFFKRKNLHEDQSSPAGSQGGSEEKEKDASEEKALVSADTKLDAQL